MAHTAKKGERVLYRGQYREVLGFAKPQQPQRHLLDSGPIIIMQNVTNGRRTRMNTADMVYSDELQAYHGVGVELNRHEVVLYSAAMGLDSVMPAAAHVKMLGFYLDKDPAQLFKALDAKAKERLTGFCRGYGIKGADVVAVAAGLRKARAEYKAQGKDVRGLVAPAHELSGMLLQMKQKLLEAALDYLTDVIRAGMTTTAFTPNFDTMDFVDDVTNELTVGGYARETLGTKAVNEDAGADEQEVDSADPTYTSLVTGETIGFSWLNKQVGGSDATPATDPLIVIHDIADTPTNGGNIVLQVDTEGWFKIGGAPA